MRFLGVVVASSVAQSAGSDPSVLDDDLIALVNSQNGAGHWIAARNSRFEGMTLTEAAGLLGVIDGPASLSNASGGENAIEALRSSAVPAEFDSRAQWPSCVNLIRDQGSCGSCWAFAAVEVLSDRFCIATGGATSATLAPQDLIACAYDNKYMLGCEGGVPEYAWRYMESKGVSTEECIPYAEADGDCPQTCADGASNWKYHSINRNHHQGTVFVPAVQQEMVAHGPVQASFEVYQDFFAYKAGIYSHLAGDLAGKHSVKLVGYGVDSGVRYWVVANSWGPSWGESGYFKIKLGVNECKIENSFDYGMPFLPAPPPPSPMPMPPTPAPMPVPTPVPTSSPLPAPVPMPTPVPTPPPSPPVEGSCRIQADEASCLGTMQYGAICTWCPGPATCQSPRTVCASWAVAV